MTRLDAFADTRRLLLCRVGVGRAYVLDDVSAERVVPPGFDSLYVHTGVDTDGDGKVSADEYDVAATHAGRPAEAYTHKYIVQESAQVLPAYLVQFQFSGRAREGDRKCDNCESAVAVLYCAADDANLCTDCDEETHSANKVVARHQRVPIRGSQNKFKSSLTDARSKVGDALALLGASAVDSTQKMIADMGECAWID